MESESLQAIMELANNPVLWALALGSICIVLWQTCLYYRMAKNYVDETGVLSPDEIKKSLKVGAISTVGPAISVFTVAVVLIGLVGGPMTLSRIGIIGSAAFESLTSSAGSGGTVGTKDFTFTLFTTATWVMALGGSGWLIATFFLTKSLDKTQEKLKKSNPKIIGLVGTIVPFMVFFVMGYSDALKKINLPEPSYGVLAAGITGAVAMFVFNYLVNKQPQLSWLREWSMGFAIILSMIVGSMVN